MRKTLLTLIALTATSYLSAAGLPESVLTDKTPADTTAQKVTATVDATSLSVLFAPDSYEIPASAKGALAQFVNTLKASPNAKVQIAGWADFTGHGPANSLLADNRAKALQKALVASGIDAGRITAAGYGEKSAVAKNMTADDKANNRKAYANIVPFTK